MSSDHESSFSQQQQHSNNYVRMTPRPPLTADYEPRPPMSADYEPMQFERTERDSSEETACGDVCFDPGEPVYSDAPYSQLGGEPVFSDAAYSGHDAGQCYDTAAGGPPVFDKANQLSSSLYTNVVVGSHVCPSEQFNVDAADAPGEHSTAAEHRRRSSVAGSEGSGAYNYDTVDSMDIMSDRYS